jgi:YfiH family protein
MNIDITKPTIFPECIVAGATQRNLQISPIGFSVKGNQYLSTESAEEHKQLLARSLGTIPERVKYTRQTHSNIIHAVGENSELEEGDGLITSERNLFLAIKIADCAAVLLYDERKKVVCGLHSGWRGTAQNIVRDGIDRLARDYSSSPADLLAWVSPCAGGERYEVGKEVAELFPRSIRPLESGKYLFDNRREIFLQLTDCGVFSDRIEISDACTISDVAYHSYRRDGNRSGRMAAFIGMK